MTNRTRSAVIALVTALILAPALSSCTASDSGVEKRETVELPQEFPAAVPLAEGDVVAADKMGESGWSASVVVKDEKAQEAALKELESDGYTQQGANEEDSNERSYSYTDGSYSVTVVLKHVGDEYSIDYSFAPIQR